MQFFDGYILRDRSADPRVLNLPVCELFAEQNCGLVGISVRTRHPYDGGCIRLALKQSKYLC